MEPLDRLTYFFKHALQEGNLVKADKNALETNDGEILIPQLPINIRTPFENYDPIIYGFELIIDVHSSPLLNGSIEQFIKTYSKLTEVKSRLPIINTFKYQFKKLFNTKGIIEFDAEEASRLNFPSNDLLNDGSPYLGYYLKKIGGLDKLTINHTSDKRTGALNEYQKDLIKLTFYEDVTSTVGSLSYLYNLLYWSKINGKNIIPQNLLRFNCDIVVSEVRSLSRVLRAIESDSTTPGQVEIIKENVSRYVYSLYECQFFFDKMPHPESVDLSNISVYGDSYEINFDYKFASLRLDRWGPTVDGVGKYTYLFNDRYDPLEIKSNDTTSANLTTTSITPIPNSPMKVVIRTIDDRFSKTEEKEDDLDSLETKSKELSKESLNDAKSEAKETLEKELGIGLIDQQNKKNRLLKLKNELKDAAERAAKQLLKDQLNKRLRLLNNMFTKITNSLGVTITPPMNIYTHKFDPSVSRFLYDVRGSLGNFLSGK
jgi:hypothetical protein